MEIAELAQVDVAAGAQIAAAVVGVAVEHGGELFAGHRVIGAEQLLAVALHNAVLGGPDHRVLIPAAGLHVGKLGRTVDPGAALDAVEDGGDHGAGGGAVAG